MKTEKESLVGKVYEDNDVPLAFEEGETTTTVFSGLVGNENDGYFVVASVSRYLEMDDEKYVVAKAPYTGNIYDEDEVANALSDLWDHWNWDVLYEDYYDTAMLMEPYYDGPDEDRAYEEWKYRDDFDDIGPYFGGDF